MLVEKYNLNLLIKFTEFELMLFGPIADIF